MPIISKPIATPQSGAINSLPYDVLQEIFVHSLPKYPLRRLTNPRHANNIPMLLCHICSFWRMVALTTPKLWSHLSCCLLMYYMDPRFASNSGLAVRKNEIDRLRWWDKNRGRIPHFLYIDIINIDGSDPKNKKDESILMNANTESVTFVMNFITSAQYLDSDASFWDEIRRKIKSGEQILFPNLHTQVQTHRVRDRKYPFLLDQSRISGSLNDVLPPFRRLHLEYAPIMMTSLEDSPFPSHWSTLTHISFFDVCISLDFWRSLIRSVPYLQWGYFHVDIRDFSDDDTIETTEHTQLNLTTLFTTFDDLSYLPTELFTRLHLPALQELLLHCLWEGWAADPDNAMTELHNVLHSTPNITILTLTDKFFSPNNSEYSPSISDDIEPIWKYAPHLIHLQIELFISVYKGDKVNEAFNTFTNNLFSDDKWLQLKKPQCPIRKITFIDGDTSDRGVINDPRFNACHVHQVIQDMPFIDIQFVSKSEIGDIKDTWEEWGARLL